jgi:hypothetical protein
VAYQSFRTPSITLTQTLSGNSILSETPPTTIPVISTQTQSLIKTQAIIPPSTDLPLPSRTRRPTLTPSLTPTLIGGGIGQIAFASDRSGVPEIWIMNVDGSNLHQITDIAEGACQPDWSPDGVRIVFTSPCDRNQESYQGSGLFIINSDGTENGSTLAHGGDYDPAWSRMDRKLLFTTLREGGMPTVYLIDVATNQVDRL